MDIKCNDKELFVFKKIAHAAEELGVPTYVIGGFVRDKLLGRATKDADIVCVGDGIQLAHKVAERFKPQPSVSFFKNFGTAQIKLKHFYEEKPGEADHKHLTEDHRDKEEIKNVIIPSAEGEVEDINSPSTGGG